MRYTLITYMQAIYNKILEDTYTFSKLKQRLVLLRNYLTSEVFSAAKIELSPEEKEWLDNLGPNFFKSFNKDNVYPLLTGLDETVKKLSPVIIYLAFEPSKEEIREIGTHIRKNFKSIQVFDLKYDPGLIGGCALVLNGIYKDYSLRSLIQANKSVLLDQMKHYELNL